MVALCATCSIILFFGFVGYNLRALSRLSDQARYFWWTYRTRPAYVGLPVRPDCSNLSEVRRWIKAISEQRFRGWIVVGFEVQKVMVSEIPGTRIPFLPFDKWPADKKAPWTVEPTHHDTPGAYAKLITFSTLYGLSVTFDLAVMDQKCWDKLFKFLVGPVTFLVGWSTWDDLWSLVLTKAQPNPLFGYDLKDPTIRLPTITVANQKRIEYEGYEMMRIRTYDLARVMKFVNRGMPTFNQADWSSVGCIPEGNSIAHLASAVLGVDISPLVPDFVCQDDYYAKYNCTLQQLSPATVRELSTFPRMMVCSFIALLRHQLLPDLMVYFPGLAHDYRAPVSYDIWFKKIVALGYSTKALRQWIISEGVGLDSYIRNPPVDEPREVGSIVDERISSHLAQVPYFYGIMPIDPGNVEKPTHFRHQWQKRRSRIDDDNEIEHPSSIAAYGFELGHIDPADPMTPRQTYFLPEEVNALPELHPYDPFRDLIPLDQRVVIPHYLLQTYPRSQQEAMIYRAVATRQYVTVAAADSTDPKKLFEPLLAHNNDFIDKSGKVGTKADPYMGHLLPFPSHYQSGNLLFTRIVTYLHEDPIWSGLETFSELTGTPDIIGRFAKLWRHTLPQDPVPEQLYINSGEVPYAWADVRVLAGFTSIDVIRQYEKESRATREAYKANSDAKNKRRNRSISPSVTARNLRLSTRSSTSQPDGSASSTATQPSTKTSSTKSTTKSTRKTKSSSSQGAVGFTMRDLASTRASSSSSAAPPSTSLASLFMPASKRDLSVGSLKVVPSSSISTSASTTTSSGSVVTPLTGPTSSTGSFMTTSTVTVSSTMSTVTPSASVSTSSLTDNVFNFPTPSVIPPIGSAQLPYSLFGASAGVSASTPATTALVASPAYRQSLVEYDRSFQNVDSNQPPFVGANITIGLPTNFGAVGQDARFDSDSPPLVHSSGYTGFGSQPGFTDPGLKEYVDRMVREAVDAKAQSYGGEDLIGRYEEAMDCLEQSSQQETAYQKQIRELAEQNRLLQEQLNRIAQAAAPAASRGQNVDQGLVAPAPQPSQPGGLLPPGFPHYPGAVNPPPGYPAWSEYPSVPAPAAPKPFQSFYDRTVTKMQESQSRSPMGQFQSPDASFVQSPLVVGPSTKYFHNVVSMGSVQPSVIPKPADVVARAQRAREASASSAATENVKRGGYAGGSASGRFTIPRREQAPSRDYSSPLLREQQSGASGGDLQAPPAKQEKVKPSGLPNLPGARYANPVLLGVLSFGMTPLPTVLQPFEVDTTHDDVMEVFQLYVTPLAVRREVQLAYRRWINLPTIQQALVPSGPKLRITDDIRDYVMQFYQHVVEGFGDANIASDAAYMLMYFIHASCERIPSYKSDKFLHVQKQADQTWKRIAGMISGRSFSDAQRQHYHQERRAAKLRDAAPAVNAGVATPADQTGPAGQVLMSAPPAGVAQASPAGAFVGVLPVVPQGPPVVSVGTAVTAVVTSTPADQQEVSIDDDDGTMGSADSLAKLQINEDPAADQ